MKELLKFYFHPYIWVIFTVPLFLFFTLSSVFYLILAILRWIDFVIWNPLAGLFLGLFILAFGGIPVTVSYFALFGIPGLWQEWDKSRFVKFVVTILIIPTAFFLAGWISNLQESLWIGLGIPLKASSWLLGF